MFFVVVPCVYGVECIVPVCAVFVHSVQQHIDLGPSPKCHAILVQW